MKKLIIIISLATLCCSCGASKKNKQREDTKEIVIDKSVVEKTKMDTSKIETSGSIAIDNFINTYNFEPFDNSKPFFINGKEFVNVKVFSKEEKTNYKEDFQRLESRYLKELDNNYKDYRREIESLKKSKDKETKEPIWLYIIGLIFFLVVIYFGKKKVEKYTL
jgi:hypothetical protein